MGIGNSCGGRRTKGKKENITPLKSDTGVSVTSTRGKLEVLQGHYQHLGRISVDSDIERGSCE